MYTIGLILTLLKHRIETHNTKQGRLRHTFTPRAAAEIGHGKASRGACPITRSAQRALLCP